MTTPSSPEQLPRSATTQSISVQFTSNWPSRIKGVTVIHYLGQTQQKLEVYPIVDVGEAMSPFTVSFVTGSASQNDYWFVSFTDQKDQQWQSDKVLCNLEQQDVANGNSVEISLAQAPDPLFTVDPPVSPSSWGSVAKVTNA